MTEKPPVLPDAYELVDRLAALLERVLRGPVDPELIDECNVALADYEAWSHRGER